MTNRLLPHRKALYATCILLLVTLGILFAMDRPPICTCGTVKLWHGVVKSAENSQHIADWYSPSHLIHGLIFYAMAYLLWQKWNLFGGRIQKWALPIAVVIEAAWEISENTEAVINRYREATISLGYAGDSIVNSMSDIGWMMIGFWAASRMPWQVSVMLAVVLELFTLWMIRDNLTLNIIMLVWPVEAIKQWQGMG